MTRAAPRPQEVHRSHRALQPPGQPGVAVENEADKITAFIGGALHDKLRAYCAKLVDRPVRGRTPAQLAADAAARQALYDEVDDELKRTVPIVINDPADAEVRLRAYLTHKLR